MSEQIDIAVDLGGDRKPQMTPMNADLAQRRQDAEAYLAGALVKASGAILRRALVAAARTSGSEARVNTPTVAANRQPHRVIGFGYELVLMKK